MGCNGCLLLDAKPLVHQHGLKLDLMEQKGMKYEKCFNGLESISHLYL